MIKFFKQNSSFSDMWSNWGGHAFYLYACVTLWSNKYKGWEYIVDKPFVSFLKSCIILKDKIFISWKHFFKDKIPIIT